MLDLILQFVSLGCMAGCALSDKLCLEVFFGFIFVAAAIRCTGRTLREK